MDVPQHAIASIFVHSFPGASRVSSAALAVPLRLRTGRISLLYAGKSAPHDARALVVHKSTFGREAQRVTSQRGQCPPAPFLGARPGCPATMQSATPSAPTSKTQARRALACACHAERTTASERFVGGARGELRVNTGVNKSPFHPVGGVSALLDSAQPLGQARVFVGHGVWSPQSSRSNRRG